MLSGRAVVKRGDTVRAGDLLIAGEERVSNDDSSVPVRAIGVVTGRVWYEGRAEINLSDIELKRTGRESVRRVMRLWDYEFEISKGEEFTLCDREITRQTGENARQNAVKKCPDNAFVIDKWTEYSIIEGDTIEARYVIEAEETIQCGG